MLLPDKHIRIAESILGLAGLTLTTLDRPMPLDKLMVALAPKLDTSVWPAAHGAENVVLALCFLHEIGVVDATLTGELFRCA